MNKEISKGDWKSEIYVVEEEEWSSYTRLQFGTIQFKNQRSTDWAIKGLTH